MKNNSKFKVIFVIQPDTMRIRASVAEKLDVGREFRATLGLLCVAGMLRDMEDVECKLVDCSASGNNYEKLRSEIEEFRPDLVALSALTFTLLDVLKSCQVAKEVDPEILTCVGGVHVNLYPKETLNFDEVDFIVHGEGEKAFKELVSALKSGEEEQIKSIQGVGSKHEKEVFLNPPGEIVKEMDSLPFPAYELLDLNKYSHVLSKGGASMSIQTSRGCPYLCTFCDIRKTKFRFKSPKRVVEEIVELKKMGISDFFIVDDTISVHRERLKDICQLLIQNKIEISYKISARVDNIDSELLRLLKESGCNRISFGVESGSQEILDILEKGVNLEQIRKTFRETKAAGLQAFAYMIIGNPNETKEGMKNSVELAKSLKADYLSVSICTPYPKTALTDRMVEAGLVPQDYWQSFVEKPTSDFRVKFWNKDFTDDELRNLQNTLLKNFYRRPTYLFGELMKVSSMSELVRKVKMGAALIR